MSLCVTSSVLVAQTFGELLTVPLEAVTDDAGPSLTLTWPSSVGADGYEVYRKEMSAGIWTSLAELGGSDTSYTDIGIGYNHRYDYKVRRFGPDGEAFGYLNGGVDVQIPENPGGIIVVADDTYMADDDYLTAYQQYVNDLVLDGWKLAEILVSTDDAVTGVHEQIQTIYDTDPDAWTHVVLVGHVPVPYSGDLYPDGHPDHEGAWPTDLYYGEMETAWTDVSVNVTVASDPRNHNIPGDGKFDQSYIPGTLELAVGRIDMHDLPSFAEDEKTLMLRYFDKVHRFRTGELRVDQRAVIDDNFTGYTEGFSQNGYRNFSALVGRDNTIQGDYLTETSYSNPSGDTYMWSYGCGGGWYQGAGGVATTTDFANDSLSAVFTMLFGSYFGDWDVSDAFSRAAIAQGNTMITSWAGRPNWHFYRMALGSTTGECALLTQNNNNTYFGSIIFGLDKIVSTNLIGDPALRSYYPKPPTEVTLSGAYPFLNWLPSLDTVDGYNAYIVCGDDHDLPEKSGWIRVNEELITMPSYSLPETGDLVPYASDKKCYVGIRSVRLIESPSGSWYAESLMDIDSSTIIWEPVIDLSPIPIRVYPNPTTSWVSVELPEGQLQYWELLDIQGKRVQGGTYMPDHTLWLNELPAGVYLLQAVVDEQRYQARITKE